MTAYHADASDLEGKEILTWETFGDATAELAAQIHHSGFDPEILIAVAPVSYTHLTLPTKA